jgi:carbon-monoxide dehydrogenase small subunit
MLDVPESDQVSFLQEERPELSVVPDEAKKLAPSTPKRRFSFEVNGLPREVQAYPITRLLDVLRRDLELTGCKEGCGEGECGSCSVMFNGLLVNSCLLPVVQAEGARIQTVESLENDPLGRRIQEAFRDFGGAQCGMCTPGMLLAAYDLLSRNPNPTLDEVRVGLAGNLCRCTGYVKIFDSVLAAARQ